MTRSGPSATTASARCWLRPAPENWDQPRWRAHYDGRPDQSKEGGRDPSLVIITNVDWSADPLR